MKASFILFVLAFPFCIVLGQGKKTLPSIRKADSLLFSGDATAARNMYSLALKDTSKNSGAWSRYGLSNLNVKKYDEAIPLFNKALTLHPPLQVKMNTYASLARAYSATGKKEKALISLDSAASLGYGNIGLLHTHADYDNIRNDERFKTIRNNIYNTANPCMTNAKAREFDFWIGEWDVYVTGTKNIAGKSKIEMIARGCALLENWDSSGSSGKSLNFIDPITGKWKQTWVGSYANGIQEFFEGEYKDGAMRFVFENINPQGRKVIGRFIFYNEKPGQVRQFNETSVDGGKTWVTSYDFTYIRK